MSPHDPLCEDKDGPRYGQYCDCRLIAQVRADEGEKRDVRWERVLYDSQARHEEKVALAAQSARADERERCAQQVGLILGPMEREARGMAGDPSTGRLWLVRADALRDAIHALRAGSAE